MKKSTAVIFVFIIAAIAMTSCADVSHVEECLPATEHTYGFFGGLWHGIIAPFAFIGSLLSDNIAVYAHNNNGGLYDLGFLIGIGAFSSGATTASKK